MMGVSGEGGSDAVSQAPPKIPRHPANDTPRRIHFERTAEHFPLPIGRPFAARSIVGKMPIDAVMHPSADSVQDVGRACREPLEVADFLKCRKLLQLTPRTAVGRDSDAPARRKDDETTHRWCLFQSRRDCRRPAKAGFDLALPVGGSATDRPENCIGAIRFHARPGKVGDFGQPILKPFSLARREGDGDCDGSGPSSPRDCGRPG